MISNERLATILERFPRLTIGLVGDLFLDRYLDIEIGTSELSIETGLEAYQITRIRNFPGALGTVINNLAALGVGALVPVTLIGDDGHGFDLRRSLHGLPVDTSFVISDDQRLTPTYTKPLRRAADGSCVEMNRLDIRVRGPLTDAATRRVCEGISEIWQRVDGLILLDQINEPNWGVINDTVRGHLRTLSGRDPEKLVLVDSRAHLGDFDFGSPKGNSREFARAIGKESEHEATAGESARQLATRNRATAFCTIGDRGILVARPAADIQCVPGVPVSGPIDIVGAGDSATSGIVASRLAGATDEEAAWIGNLVASITVQQIGVTGTARPIQVLERNRVVKQ